VTRTALVAAVALAACSYTDVRREVYVREQALLLPEAIAPSEPLAERVTILHASGRNLVFHGVVIGRVDETLVVTDGGTPYRVPLADARAVQIERTLVGPDRKRLEAKHLAPPDVVVQPGWGIVLGVVALLTSTIIVVSALDED